MTEGLFDADRRKSWQRLSLSVGTVALSTLMLVLFYIGEQTWGQVVLGALGLFVGSETVRHYRRLGVEAKSDQSSGAEPYNEPPV